MRLVVFNKPGRIVSSHPFIGGWTLIQFPKRHDSQDIVIWAKSKISVIASVIYHWQNPLESMYLYFAYQHLMSEGLSITFTQMEDIFFILRVTKLHFIMNSSDILFLYTFWTLSASCQSSQKEAREQERVSESKCDMFQDQPMNSHRFAQYTVKAIKLKLWCTIVQYHLCHCRWSWR